MSRWNPETIAFSLLLTLTFTLFLFAGGAMLEALGLKSLDWVEVARGKMQSDDPAIRLQGAKLLTTIDDSSLTTLHRSLLNDPSQAVRRAAIEGLRTRQAPHFLDFHLKALSDPVTSLRQLAVENLNHTGTAPWVGEALLKALSDYQPRVQTLALETAVRSYLPKSADRRFAEPLQFLATDPRPAVRSLAVKGLGLLRDPSAQPVLERLAGVDPDPEIREGAERALTQIARLTPNQHTQ
ncbi:MAG TPA: HEAT repeat domain-containing protein [Candidatus Ozemobacteraceae bacterium]|nr:HEAT repeat domain-containing protein [Candidatus Ozemobacteraceae bacterium]